MGSRGARWRRWRFGRGRRIGRLEPPAVRRIERLIARALLRRAKIALTLTDSWKTTTGVEVVSYVPA